MDQPKQKILINWRAGAERAEDATVTLILAVTSAKTCETALFVAAEASGLLVRGAAAAVNAPGYEQLADLLSAFVASGGRIWLCPACVKAKGIDPDSLIDGVEVAGAPKTLAFLDSGAQMLA